MTPGLNAHARRAAIAARIHTDREVDFATLADIPARYIGDVELDDAPLTFEGDIIADTFHGRRLPGEGELDVQGFVDAIRSTGYDGIWGVEILSSDYRKLPITEAVPAAYRTSMQFLTQS